MLYSYYGQASNEFTDSRLKFHILTVLKSLHTSTQSKIRPDSKETSKFVFDSTSQEEFFRLLAECENEKCPGGKLLAKSKELQWPLLAVVASCFDDVKPVSCLRIWLKITAARFVLILCSLNWHSLEQCLLHASFRHFLTLDTLKEMQSLVLFGTWLNSYWDETFAMLG